MTAQVKTLTQSTNGAQEIVAGASHTDLASHAEVRRRYCPASLAVVDSVRTTAPCVGEVLLLQTGDTPGVLESPGHTPAR
jgi:hypothetical protein